MRLLEFTYPYKSEHVFCKLYRYMTPAYSKWLQQQTKKQKNKKKRLGVLSLVPTKLLTNKHKYFFKLLYKILSAVTRK